MDRFESLFDEFPYVYRFIDDAWEVSHKENGAIITKPVDETIDDYFKKIGVNKPYGFYGYMDETEIKVYKNKDIEQAIYLERKRRKTNPGPEYY